MVIQPINSWVNGTIPYRETIEKMRMFPDGVSSVRLALALSMTPKITNTILKNLQRRGIVENSQGDLWRIKSS